MLSTEVIPLQNLYLLHRYLKRNVHSCPPQKLRSVDHCAHRILLVAIYKFIFISREPTGFPSILPSQIMLSDSEDEQQSAELHKITINEHYAKAFQHRKEREELDKRMPITPSLCPDLTLVVCDKPVKTLLGSDVSESDLEEEADSESAESEDEDGEELTPVVDVAILRTLARIRQKDPSIYESGKSIFGGMLFHWICLRERYHC